MKRDGISATVFLVTLCGCARDERSYRTLRLSFGSFPIQSIVLAGIAQDFLRELTFASIGRRLVRRNMLALIVGGSVVIPNMV